MIIVKQQKYTEIRVYSVRKKKRKKREKKMRKMRKEKEKELQVVKYCSWSSKANLCIILYKSGS
jgi:hypothetical protein